MTNGAQLSDTWCVAWLLKSHDLKEREKRHQLRSLSVRLHGLCSLMPNTITEKSFRLHTMTPVNAFFTVHELRCIELAPNIRHLHEFWAPLDIKS